MTTVITNLAMFKVGWLACVLGAAAGMPWLGVLAVAAASAIHIASAHDKSKTMTLLATAALIGLTWESLMVFSGYLDYSATGHTGVVAPYWIIAMWVLFATTLSLGFSWLKNRLFLATLLGGIGGPMAFAAGAKAGAVQFSDPVLSLVVVGAGWAVLMPLMVFLARYLNGHEVAAEAVLEADQRGMPRGAAGNVSRNVPGNAPGNAMNSQSHSHMSNQ